MSSVIIPWQLEERPDTGTTNGRLAIWLFLASEVLFFGALFSSYLLLRLGQEADGVWPRGAERLDLPLATINSLILIASSITVMRAFEFASAGAISRSRRWLTLTFGLGGVFVAIKLWEWNDKLSHGAGPASDLFAGLYFTLTGVHLVHLLGGMVAVAVLALAAGSAGGERPEAAERYALRVEIAGIYWHFVDLVWLVLFAVLYLT